MTITSELLSLLKKAKGITHNSKEVKEGYIFFALKGIKHDGHLFVKEALEKKALAVVVETDIPLKRGRIIKVDSTRRALAESAHLFFGKPSEKLSIIGITGTNGKTTTAYILTEILSNAGEKTGYIGTVNYRIGKKVFLKEGQTTPDSILWHKTLKSMVKEGATHVVAEISSHALDQERVWGTKFDTVIFTNLSRDHLDYHKNMENYYRAKERLFTDYRYNLALVNSDDLYGKRLLKVLKGAVFTFGKKGYMKIENFRSDLSGSEIVLNFEGKRYTFKSNLVGGFQASNIAAAVLCAFKKGIKEEIIEKSLLNVKIPGRFEVIRSDRGFSVIIDYAHTPQAIYSVLETARKLTKGKLIAVFGAGGDRDKEKRPLMGKAAEKWSDVIVLTSDNPRSEDPKLIASDILKGIKSKEKVILELDREKAIKYALEIAREGDMIAILGKGHESYQEIKGIKYPFSDREIVLSILGGENAL